VVLSAPCYAIAMGQITNVECLETDVTTVTIINTGVRSSFDGQSAADDVVTMS